MDNLRNIENPESTFDSGLSDSTDIVRDISDTAVLSETIWWEEIKEVIFPEIKDTTFLKIFFSIPFYLHKMENYHIRLHYEKIYDDIQKKLKNGRYTEEKTYNTLAATIINCVDVVFSETIGKLKNLERSVTNKDNYSNDMKRFVYSQYKDHADFYISFFTDIFKAFYDRKQIDVDQKNKKIYDEIYTLTENKMNRKFENPIENLSFYLYFFILLKTTDNQNGLFSSDIIAKRLRNCNNSSVQEDLSEYASILEYYPINTIERLGALHQAASLRNGRRNLYAVSELYFLYYYGTVLSNISGDKKYILKKNPDEAKNYYNIIISSEESDGFLPVILNHDGYGNDIFDSIDDRTFTPKTIQFHRKRYGTYNERQKISMIQSLIDIYQHPQGAPINLDLMFFLEEVHAEQLSPDCIEIVNDVKNNWYSKLTNVYSDENLDKLFSTHKNNSLPIHEILYIFLKKLPDIGNNDLLKQLCSTYSEYDLNMSANIAKQNATDYYSKSLDSSLYNEEYTIWGQIYQLLKESL